MTEKYTKVVESNLTFPRITVWKLLCDGERYGYEARADDGYEMYNPNANEVRIDENGEHHPYTHYCSVVGFPKNYNFDNFPYVAVLRS